jgi:tartrate dehydratase alpha subunit/fumarate hydratase class I-like protein
MDMTATATPAAGSTNTTADATTTAATSANSPLAVGLGIGGLVLGAIALVVSALAFTRKSRPTGTNGNTAANNSTIAGK